MELHSQPDPTPPPAEIKFGPLSLGDLIALGGVLFMGGALWFQVGLMQTEQTRISERVQALEQVVPNEYVRRQDYREDVREIKELLRRIEVKVDGKADKP
jgi:hypothetical protein